MHASSNSVPLTCASDLCRSMFALARGILFAKVLFTRVLFRWGLCFCALWCGAIANGTGESAHAETPSLSDATLFPTLSPTAAAQADSDSGPLGPLNVSPNSKDAPTYISSDLLTVNTEQRTFLYERNVTVIHADMTLTCNTLEGNYTEENKIDKLHARGNVVITRGVVPPGSGAPTVGTPAAGAIPGATPAAALTGRTSAGGVHATSEVADYDANTSEVVLTVNPSVEQDGSVLTADKITVLLNENKSKAEGQVRVRLVKRGEPTPVGTPGVAVARDSSSGSKGGGLKSLR